MRWISNPGVLRLKPQSIPPLSFWGRLNEYYEFLGT